MAGGTRTFITPRDCGAYPSSGEMTSHNGSVFTLRQTLRITGCPVVPFFRDLAISPGLPAAGRPAILTWKVSTPVRSVALELRRWSRARRVWSSLGAVVLNGAAARAARTRLVKWRGRRLTAGRYAAVLRATSAAGVESRASTLGFRLR